VSVANVAVDLALNIFGGLSHVRVLLLGAGEIGEKTARAFQSRGAPALTVASRRLERAMELATALGGSAMPFEQCEQRLGEFDIVVCATAAPQAVISLAATGAAMRKRPAQPLFFIDLALPRDVDPASADLDNVFLYNLDDLAKIAEENRAAREAEIAKCRAIVAEKADALWRHVEPQVTALENTPTPEKHPSDGGAVPSPRV
jgi:glutamyl-tRNA reductase